MATILFSSNIQRYNIKAINILYYYTFLFLGENFMQKLWGNMVIWNTLWDFFHHIETCQTTPYICSYTIMSLFGVAIYPQNIWRTPAMWHNYIYTNVAGSLAGCHTPVAMRWQAQTNMKSWHVWNISVNGIKDKTCNSLWYGWIHEGCF